jgi:hypothetical protein
MATIATLIGAANNSDLSAYTTNSFTPVAGDFLICNIIATETLITGTITDTQNLGWTLIGSVNDGTNILIMYYSNRTADATAMTVTWDCTGDSATSARVGVIAFRGSDANVRQFATGTGLAASTPSVTFGSAITNTSACFALFSNYQNPATITPSTGWTEIADAGWSLPTTGSQLQRINSGETTTILNWGSASGTNWLAMAIEVYDSGAASGSQPYNYIDGAYGYVM